MASSPASEALSIACARSLRVCTGNRPCQRKIHRGNASYRPYSRCSTRSGLWPGRVLVNSDSTPTRVGGWTRLAGADGASAPTPASLGRGGPRGRPAGSRTTGAESDAQLLRALGADGASPPGFRPATPARSTRWGEGLHGAPPRHAAAASPRASGRRHALARRAITPIGGVRFLADWAALGRAHHGCATRRWMTPALGRSLPEGSPGGPVSETAGARPGRIRRTAAPAGADTSGSVRRP